MFSSRKSSAPAAAGGYNLTKSLRFRASASAYLNRTFGTPTDPLKWTWSSWVKRSNIGSNGTLIAGVTSGSVYSELRFVSTDILRFHQENGATTVSQIDTVAVFRDPSAWYHVVCVYDSANATSANRLLIYINGVLQTTTAVVAVPPSQASNINKASEPSQIGNLTVGPLPFDGYMAEINFIDGQALTPSSFGETSAATGVWQPIIYTGTYGTNGFYLPFTDTTSTSTLGTDFSGNSNTWTVNNISLTSGSTYDSMTDVPTLTSATTANYCVMSPIASSPLISLTNGNLTAGGTDEASLIGTIGVNSGKWYWEVTVTSGSVTPYLGVSSNSFDKSGSGSNYLLAGISWYGNGLKKAYTGTSSTSATSNTTGVYGFALDISAGTLDYYFNNSLVFTDTTIPTSGVTLFPFVVHTNSGSNSWNPANFNFGQQPLSYTPPTGFVALNTFNLPTPTIGATASTTANKYMDVSLYTGNGAVRSITNSGSMQPDWVWIKNRSSGSFWHQLYDSVRGVLKALFSNETNSESTYTDTLTAFTSTGFNLGTDATFNGGVNKPSDAYVAWQWRASNATAVTNTDGNINSSVSANTTSGFSIVTYTGNATTSSTVGHGLGVTPTFFILKSRGTQVWNVYSLAGGITGNTILQLDSTDPAVTGSNISLTASPTTIGFGSAAQVNGSGVNFVAYCFAPVAGYSAFGTYTGNGDPNGPFIYTGFRPRFIILKRYDAGADAWIMMDTSTQTYNVVGNFLQPSQPDQELYAVICDFLSNGFKLRETYTTINTSNGTYIYMAFAEYPFKYANAR